jgi:hydrogenase maturation factor
MKKNLKLFGALAALFVLIWFARPWERQPRQLEAYDRKIDSLERVAARFNYEAAEAWLAMKEAKALADLAAVRVDSLNRSIQGLKKKHGQLIEVLRSQPPDSVMTTTLAMAECDSCLEVGFQMQLVNEEQASEIIDLRSSLDNCQDAYSKKDSAEQVKTEQMEVCQEKNISLEKEVKKGKWIQGGLFLAILFALLL